MAKKILGPDDAINKWKEMMLRASLSNYYNVNGILLSKNTDNKIIIVVPDKLLLTMLLEDADNKIEIFDESDDETKEFKGLFKYGENLSEKGWFSLVSNTDLYDGKSIEINISGYEYPIIINRELLPIKLKKAEYVDLDYKIFIDPLVMAIKKDFNILEGFNFSMIRLFKII